MIVVTADAGGTKTTVAVTDDGRRLIEIRGPGAAVRPGRALVSATIIAQLTRSALAQVKLIQADAIVIGAAGAGRAADAEDLRRAMAWERLADRVVVVSDVGLAFEALGTEVGLVLVAGTGSVVIGRTATGQPLRQGGYGWQMGDEGAGYWIGRQALTLVGAAHDGRGPATALSKPLLAATGATDFRDLVGWTTVAGQREIAGLSRAVVATADQGDAGAQNILGQAAAHLALLVNVLAPEFPGAQGIQVGLAGGLIGQDGPLREQVRPLIKPPFVPLLSAVDPLLGGPRLVR